MKILMFGWEYPPVKSGGLGTACYGLTRELSSLGQDIVFVAPRAVKSDYSSHMEILSLNSPKRLKFNDITRIEESFWQKIGITEEMTKKINYQFINANLDPYYYHSQNTLEIEDSEIIKKYIETSQQSINEIFTGGENIFIEYDISQNERVAIYGDDLFNEVQKYTDNAKLLALSHEFDIIVAHDWMTFGAAVAVQEITGKPLVVHIHATEFDRTGGNLNEHIYQLEKLGMTKADLVIANSYITKENCIKDYGISPRKIIPIHLGMDNEERLSFDSSKIKSKDEKVVLYFGRITSQKGPEYFLRAAKEVLAYLPDTKFIMAGSGDKLNDMIDLAISLGIEDKVFFTGFLQGKSIDKIFEIADVFVLSSIAEPFGLVVLEAIKKGCPAIVSKKAGVSEMLSHVLKIDFWDIYEMANKIIGVLKHEELYSELLDNSMKEASSITWEKSADKILGVYEKALKKESLVYA